MAVVPIVVYPAPVLLKNAAAITDIDGFLQKRIDDMIETLYAVPGLGLAAPQVGDSCRLFVYDLSVQDEERPSHRKGPIVVINPEIIAQEGEEVAEEGCLSIPGYHENIKRAYRVELTGWDRKGKQIRLVGEGLLARLFQHELDHINGVLMFNHLSSLKRNILLKKLKKEQREGGAS